ncbi:LexA family transcriptional regulator [Pseudomonas mandelii]|uniref:LexA family transcriptional regulator n=1 Tax=Pseudomonas mandelii TaxID=75612 RepID=UPI00224AD52D|nr:helix-turn-helix transcriptional regulator [Pseudomonas mandelii]MCX2896815.1 helix-turn-helix transcriptional regulator [Pseudomonas mandelii]
MDIKKLRIQALRNLMGEKTQKEFAEQHNLDASYLSQLLNGHRTLGEKAAANLEAKIGLPEGTLRAPFVPMHDSTDGHQQQASEDQAVKSNADFLGPIDVWDDDTPLDDDEVYVPFLKEVELSAGSGRTAVQQSHKQKLRFGKRTLRRQNVQANEAVCVTVNGNSMEPVLPHGSTVGVDQGCTTITDGKMYALNHGGQLRVKTLYRLPGGGLRMRSYNRDEHPDEEYSALELVKNEIIVIGKVFWYSVLL